ncbi:MAG: N-acetyltransferase family protein [Phascolarctobacterium sp.]|nr:N-acetyltransferase family protein [Phascolarctobacterium sp.]
MDKNVKLRLATLEDAEELLKIYTPFVESEDRNISDVSFEYVAPSVEEFRDRIRNISSGYPYLIIEKDGRALGYAYAHPYILREAYQWCAEATIYLAPEGQGKGYGRILYETLEKLLILQGVTNTYACITKSNTHSVMMHGALGYKINGEFSNCGYKHGHWLDMVWMEKIIQEHKEKPALLKAFKELEASVVAEVLNSVNSN